jgi:hypothetical protein
LAVASVHGTSQKIVDACAAVGAEHGPELEFPRPSNLIVMGYVIPFPTISVLLRPPKSNNEVSEAGSIDPVRLVSVRRRKLVALVISTRDI